MFYKDDAEWNQLSFQDMGSPIGEKLVFFHDNIMFIIVVITILVGWMMLSSFANKHYYTYLVHGTVIEVVWTIIPAVVLVFIAFPSLQLLYSMDEITDPSLTIKAVGHQWYWSYEYSDIEEESIEFYSYMVPSLDLEEGDLRLHRSTKTFDPSVASMVPTFFLCFLVRRIQKWYQFCPIRSSFWDTDVTHYWPNLTYIELSMAQVKAISTLIFKMEWTWEVCSHCSL